MPFNLPPDFPSPPPPPDQPKKVFSVEWTITPAQAQLVRDWWAAQPVAQHAIECRSCGAQVASHEHACSYCKTERPDSGPELIEITTLQDSEARGWSPDRR